MNPIRLRTLTRADLNFAESVRTIEGWNQTRQDWERFLATGPHGCFLAEWNGIPAGTATTTIYDGVLGWIGLVLVHPDSRRRGVGKALLQQSIEYLKGCGVQCIKLDATPLGKLLYEGLGFRSEWTLARWQGSLANLPKDEPDRELRPWIDADAARVAALDKSAFGVARRQIIAALGHQNIAGLVLESEQGDVTGFGMLRAGSRALYLGPVVAALPNAGARLVEALLARTAGKTVFWDIPDENDKATSFAISQGFSVQRRLTRMFLGENLAPGDPRRQFALGGPEIG